MTLPNWFNDICYFVTFFSVLYAVLPPWEQFNDYPTFQRWYRFMMIFVVKFGSLNVRSIVNPTIQATANQGGTTSK